MQVIKPVQKDDTIIEHNLQLFVFIKMIAKIITMRRKKNRKYGLRRKILSTRRHWNFYGKIFLFM